MKHTCLLITLFLFYCHVSAQDFLYEDSAAAAAPAPAAQPVRPAKVVYIASARNNHYDIFSAEVSTFFAHHAGHDITANFPYTVTSDVNGSVNQQNFNARLQGTFTSPIYLAGANYEIDRKRHGIAIGVGGFWEDGGDHGWYVKAGYRYLISLGNLLLKPSVDLYYLFGKDKMGSIDNHQKEIDLFGYTAHQQFTINEDDASGNYVNNTYNASKLDINYKRSTALANPKLVLSTRPIGHLVFSMECGWMIQLVQSCKLQLQQESDDTGRKYTVGGLALDNNGSLGGMYASVSIGVSL